MGDGRDVCQAIAEAGKVIRTASTCANVTRTCLFSRARPPEE